MFVDTQDKVEDQIKRDIADALGQSFDIALGGDSRVQFNIENI